jgi:hypothetical protein
VYRLAYNDDVAAFENANPALKCWTTFIASETVH